MKSSSVDWLWFLYVFSLVLAVRSLRSDADCPSGCNHDRCHCSKDDSNQGLLITCEELTESFFSCLDSNVLEFHLHKSTLTSVGPTDFRNITNLDKLDISDNAHLQTIERDTFAGLSSLRYLYLDHNSLSTLEHPIFPTNGSLEELRLNDNHLSKIRYETVFAGLNTSLVRLRLYRNELEEFSCSGLGRLEELELLENHIRSIKDESFHGCPNIEILILAGNHLEKLNLNWALLPSLKILDLSFNMIEELGSEFHRSMLSLQSLFLDFNMLRGVPRFPVTLVKLALSGNRFEIIKTDAFKNLTELRELEIDDVPTLKTIEESAFAGLKSLYQLSIRNNIMLNSLPLQPWPDSKSLKELILSWNSISIFPREVFEDLDDAWNVVITGNPINCSCDSAWIRTEMDNENNWWIHRWINESQAVKCFSPENLRGYLISQLHSHDLTCDPAILELHTTTTTKDKVVLEAMLTGGVPSTSWYLPDGRHIIAHRSRLTVEPTVEEIQLENMTIVARLTILAGDQALSSSPESNQYTLEWVNAGGAENFTFTATPPPPPSGGSHPAVVAVVILSIAMVAIVAVGGFFLYRYLRAKRYQQMVEEIPDVTSSSTTHVQNEPDMGPALLSVSTGYGSTGTT